MRASVNDASRQHAFTRAELLVILAVLAVLAAVVLPGLANNRSRSERVICANNLRQIGMAMQLWGNDHGDRPPYEVEPVEGGTRRHALAANTWLHYAWLSNDLATPKVLLCPSDVGNPAQDFSHNPSGGYLHPNFANRATSYFLSYRIVTPSLRVQAGDRNIRFNSGAGPCTVFNVGRSMARPIPASYQPWTNDLHEEAGNFLTFDGSVEQSNNEHFRDALSAINAFDVGVIHFSVPR